MEPEIKSNKIATDATSHYVPETVHNYILIINLYATLKMPKILN